MEKAVGMYVLKSAHDLNENTFDACIVQALVVPCLHKLVQISLHIFHRDMKLLAERVKENVEGGHEVRMRRKSSKKNNFAKLETMGK